jgi:hypothetical protein
MTSSNAEAGSRIDELSGARVAAAAPTSLEQLTLENDDIERAVAALSGIDD